MHGKKTGIRVSTWNPDCEQVVVTESLVQCQSLVSSLPAGGIPVAGHSLDHHDAQGEVSLHRFLIVMDRLARLSGVFGSDAFLLVFFQAAKLILGNVSSILSWVTGWVLVAEKGVPQASLDALHLLKSLIKPCIDRYTPDNSLTSFLSKL